MKIKMIGIDFNIASLEKRELFSFTSSQAEDAMRFFKHQRGVEGCVIISTCNRTEVWTSIADGEDVDLIYCICKYRELETLEYQDLFISRAEKTAINHLFETACGLNSQIFGEDQIITQIRLALELAREKGLADETLEKLFHSAITSAKRVKTEVKLTAQDTSVPIKVLEIIKGKYVNLKDKTCLIIGNGEMGRMTARLLVNDGAKVTVTLRTYRHGSSVVPEFCEVVDYEKRLSKLSESDIIISATSSPHCTLNLSDVEDVLQDGKQRILFDLAVPRDIQPEIAELNDIELINMDSLIFDVSIEERERARNSAKIIIDRYIEEYEAWNKTKKSLPLINTIVNSAAERILGSLKNDFDSLNLEKEMRNSLEDRVSKVAEKAVSAILFGLKENISDEHLELCIKKLKNVRESVK